MKEKNLPAIKIIQQIKDGEINPQELSQDARQLVVECLLMELKSVSEIAAFLKANERTIQRDKYDIDQRGPVISPSNASLESLIDLVKKNEEAIQKLNTLSKPKQAEAASYLWENIQEQMKLLRDLGCLPENRQ